jgi:hypothetical protein
MTRDLMDRVRDIPIKGSDKVIVIGHESRINPGLFKGSHTILTRENKLFAYSNNVQRLQGFYNLNELSDYGYSMTIIR